MRASACVWAILFAATCAEFAAAESFWRRAPIASPASWTPDRIGRQPFLPESPDRWGAGPRSGADDNGQPQIRQDRQASQFRLPGEFERQQCLLLSCGGLTPAYAAKIAEIAEIVQQNIRVVVLYSEADHQTMVIDALRDRNLSPLAVEFLELPHDTKWIRDYGPTVVCDQNGGGVVVDWQYNLGRPNDDDVPLHIAVAGQARLEPSPIVLEGGNLLSNGCGLCITTTTLFDRNAEVNQEASTVLDGLRASVGAEQIVVLEPLAGEPTGHVDMFATFTGPGTVVVGEYEQDDDPENKAILDRNAVLLSQIQMPQGRLRVERIPMGSHDDDIWRTYTNCVYANGVLLAPTYSNQNALQQSKALAVYRRLLPAWRIALIDASELIEEGGALHCASITISTLEGLNQSSPRHRLQQVSHDVALRRAGRD